MESIPISFALSLALLVIPVLGGFMLHADLTAITYFVIALLTTEAGAVFYYEAVVRELKPVEWRTDAVTAGFSAIVLAAAGIVLRLGGQLYAIGDNKYHLAKIRRIMDVTALSPQALTIFKDGGPHPGYAYPVYHIYLALISKLSGLDPVLAWVWGHSFLTLIFPLAVYAAISVMFKNRHLAIVAALIILVPMMGIDYSNLATLRLLMHPADFSAQILLYLILTLTFYAVFKRDRSYPLLALAALLMVFQVFMHVTNMVFLLVPLAGFFAALLISGFREPAERESLLRLGGLIAAAVTAGFIYSLLTADLATATVAGETFAYYQKSKGVLEVAPGIFAVTFAPASVLLLLYTSLQLPLVRKLKGALYAVASVIAVFFINLIPYVFAALAGVIAISQTLRMPVVIFTAAIYAMPIFLALAWSERLWKGKRGATAALPAAAGLSVLYFLIQYLVSLGSGLNSPILFYLVGVVLVVSLSAFLIYELRFAHRGRAGKTIVELVAVNIRPEIMGVFLLVILIYNIPQFSVLPKSMEAIPFIERADGIEGDTYYWNSAYLEFIRTRVPRDAVVLSDPQTSETLPTFVDRYIATMPAFHMSASEAGEDPLDRSRKVLGVFEPGADPNAKRAVIDKYQADFVVYNKYFYFNMARKQSIDPSLPSEVLAKLKEIKGLQEVYNDGQFVVFRVER